MVMGEGNSLLAMLRSLLRGRHQHLAESHEADLETDGRLAKCKQTEIVKHFWHSTSFFQRLAEALCYCSAVK